MEAFETFEHAGCTIELHYDEEPTAPSDWDQLGELVAFDSLWNKYPFTERVSSATEDDAVKRGGSALLIRYLRLCHGIYAVPFHFADYGGNGRVLADIDGDNPSGFIAATPESIKKMGTSLDDVERVLVSELKNWDAYCEGRVIGYVVRAGTPEDVRYVANLSTIDSCWGFYPDDDETGDGYEYVRAEARASAEHEASEREAALVIGIPTVES